MNCFKKFKDYLSSKRSKASLQGETYDRDSPNPKRALKGRKPKKEIISQN